ncbi:hypothetical protein [Ramlibacter pallidus]|uniref:Uncharacterized protein n=1 Tax=Ramlibacter pallidus TaxID=2780087 RepID=A0ABR9S6M0_9BURK|nr:hypothetical protein [Ramlibacter pallidus]MBE7369175.1 hypothetical protein [Ramlibacter pallidus]
MTAIAQDFWEEQADEPEVRIDGRIQPDAEDTYWQSAYWAQPYFRAELSYDDYAPAYCVGYIGFAQYGGRFEDAEKSLCANWIRIKGDSRLELDEAMQAIRAAWDHAESAQFEADEEVGELVEAGLLAAHAREQRQPAYA